MGCWFFGRIASHDLAKKCWKAESNFSPLFWRVRHIYVTYICFIVGTKEWKDHIHLLFLYVCFFVSMFFCGAKFIAKPAGVGAASQVFTPRRFWKLRRSPCGLGDLGLGGFGMVGWMLGVIFWQGMEHLACCLINFFSWGLGTRLKVGVLFFYVFDVCMFFLYISLKISELILWSWDCSDFKSCLYSERTSWCPNCFLLTLWKTKLKPCGSHSFWFHGCKSLCIPWCCFKKHSSLSPNWTEKNSK